MRSQSADHGYLSSRVSQYLPVYSLDPARPFQSLSAAAKSLQRQGGRPLLLLEVKPSVLAIWTGADPEAFVVSQSEAEAAQLIDDRGKVVT